MGADGKAHNAPPEQRYAGDERDAAVKNAESGIGRSTGVFTGLTEIGNASAGAQRWARQQGAELTRSVDTQPGPTIGAHDYLTDDQQTLYDMVNTDADPAMVNAAGEWWNQTGNALVDTAKDLSDVVTASHQSWQGAAADRMRDFYTGMADWHGAAGQGGQLAGNRLSAQAEALQYARAAMPSPDEYSVGDMLGSLADSPDPVSVLATAKQRLDAANANHAEMARVAEQYDGVLGENAAMPVFSPLPGPTTATTSALAGAAAASDWWNARSSKADVPESQKAEPPRQAAPPAATHQQSGTPGSSGTSSPDPGTSAGEPTDSGSAPTTGSTSTTGSTPGTAAPGPATAERTTTAGWSPTPATGTATGGGPATDHGIGGGSGNGGGWAADGSGLGLPGTPASQSVRATTPIPPTVTAPVPVAGQVGNDTGPSAVERGQAGAAGEPGLPTGGAGRRSAEKDAEHRSPAYLREANPDELFGTDELVAPPVFGV